MVPTITSRKDCKRWVSRARHEVRLKLVAAKLSALAGNGSEHRTMPTVAVWCSSHLAEILMRQLIAAQVPRNILANALAPLTSVRLDCRT
jgi:hypothetical protein